MAHRFDDIFGGLRRAAELLAASGQLQTRALEQMVGVADAALHTYDEHEDLRETVGRLEATVLDLVDEVRRLKNGDSRG